MIPLQAGLRRASGNVRVCHVVDLLDEAYRLGGDGH